MVKSRFSFKYYYSKYLIAAAILTPAIFGLSHPDEMVVVKNGVRENGLIICYVLLGMGLCFLLFLINWVVVEVWPDRLVLRRLFWKSIVLKEEITFIDLMARKKSVNQWRLVDAIVITRGTKQMRILVNAYRNVPELKREMQRYFLPAQPVEATAHSVPAGALAPGSTVTYARSWLTSGCGLMFCGIVIIAGFLLLVPHGPLLIRSGLFLALVVPGYFWIGNLQFFFLVDQQALIIRNHFFPWYKRQFSVAGIRRAIIEDGLQHTIALRITMRDFECHAFVAESLRMPEWKALAKRLGENGILVVDEAY